MKEFIEKLQFSIDKTIKGLNIMCEVNRKEFFILLIANLMLGLLPPLNLYIYKLFIDELSQIISSENYIFNNLFLILLIYVSMKILTRIILQIKDYISFKFFTEMDKYFTNNITRKISRISMEDFESTETYNLIQMSYENSLVKNKQVLEITMDLIKSIITFTGVSLIIIQLSLICFILCIISVIPIFYNEMVVLESMYEEYNKQFSGLRYIQKLKLNLINYNWLIETKIFNSADYILKKIIQIYDKNLSNNLKIKLKYLKKANILIWIDEIIVGIISVIIIKISIEKKGSIGSIILYFQSANTLKETVSNILSSFQGSYENSLYLDKYFSLMGIKEDITEGEVLGELEKVHFENVFFKYPDSEEMVIRNFNFIFKSNRSYGIVGMNGAGKTSLIKLLAGLYKPSDGKIYANDIDYDLINKKQYYKKINLVQQDFNKYPLSIRENISIGNKNLSNEKLATDNEIKYIMDKVDLSKKIQSMNFDKILSKDMDEGVEISGGEWQKLAIMRAIYKPKDILILDEPTASIDSLSEANLFNNLKKMDKIKIKILITHRLINLKFVDEILVLDDGELIDYGTHDYLIENNKLYKDLYNSQFNI